MVHWISQAKKELHTLQVKIDFEYHHKCQTSKLTHLCFADDLLIFTDGSLSSVQNILQILEEFERLSGLAVSLQKTSFFSSGLSESEIQVISSTTGLTHGSLPIRYLGIPLSSKKLSLLNCAPLLQHIKGKINSWSARSFSFAGRLLMLKTVIAGITNFWCSTFVIPKACVKKINSLCSAYLWQGTTEGHHSARVAWETITLSKEEGGLGCRDLVTWNKACTLKLVWLLFCNSGSIWVAWYVNEVLQGSLSNYWTCKVKQKHSWLANKLIKIRDTAYNWIKRRVGNGKNTRFWTDNWSPFGDLRNFLQSETTRRMRIGTLTTLNDLYSNGHWNLAPARSENQVILQSHLTTLSLSDTEDYYEWICDDVVWTKYLTGKMYDSLKAHAPIVPWKTSVWNSGGIPKHSFLTWLFVLNRSPTKDRLLNWGLLVDPMCLLCNRCAENKNHLFFDCSFSWSIWGHLGSRCGIIPSKSWDSTLLHLQQLQGRRSKRKLTLLVWQCAIYFIWTERNARLHRNAFRSASSIISSIDSLIRNRCSSLRDVNSNQASEMIQLWFSTSSV
ncbi:unnamed protein product [Microthlaspi erraticum]|uniref:Reverse transcriptase domain-containing protein n=1 Tax=Microthlaspi erraticum TaxID=1685480 RepID=A0A6D2JE77_9BRAS|nr:unnamed protein product [Microthlaspi erraticum]